MIWHLSQQKVMAQAMGLEHLPEDALRNILVRVAKAPTGAVDVVNVFAISKYFRSFKDDSDVLRAVSFKDFYQGLQPSYGLLCEVRGLLLKCAREGHPDACYILAKVALLSISRLLNAPTEAGNSSESPFPMDEGLNPATMNRNLIDLDKASRLINYLSVWDSDSTVIIRLARLFLAHASVPDLIKMHDFLIDFLTLYSSPDKEAEKGGFLDLLHQMGERNSCRILFVEHRPAFLVGTFNLLCSMGHDNMVAMGHDEAHIRFLLQCKLDMSQYLDVFVYEALKQRLEIVEPFLRLAGQVASTLGNPQLIRRNNIIWSMAAILRMHLQRHMEHTEFVESHRGLMLSWFDDIFDV